MYLDEWIKSGPYRESDIIYIWSLIKMQKTLPLIDLSSEVKEEVEQLVRDGKLVIVSEAAFKNSKWKGPKILAFESKEKGR